MRIPGWPFLSGREDPKQQQSFSMIHPISINTTRRLLRRFNECPSNFPKNKRGFGKYSPLLSLNYRPTFLSLCVRVCIKSDEVGRKQVHPGI